MSHDLLITDGKAHMMYHGETPWHGLGRHLDHPPTAKEAIEAAGLDWDVVKEPIAFLVDGKDPVVIKNRYAVVPGEGWSSPTRPCLGIVGQEYRPLQNTAAFAFFDPIVEKHAAAYETAGAIDAGRRIWILAKLPGEIRVVGDDITQKYLLLSNSHDGSSAVQLKFTPIRVVCQNTLSMALSQGRSIRAPHTPDMHRRLREAELVLGMVEAQYRILADAFQAMTRVQMDTVRLKEYLCAIFPEPARANERAHAAMTKDRTRAASYFVDGTGNKLEGVRGTLWAAYNGVVEYVDYGRSHTTPIRRLNSVWFGTGHKIKARAFSIAEEMCV